MATTPLELLDLSFGYPSAPAALFDDVSMRIAPGWTAVVGPNGAGKTTLLQLITGVLEPTSGRVRTPGDAILCPQRTDEPPDGFDELCASEERRLYKLRGRLGVEIDWASRWSSLSHGERKRAQIAVALWREPAVLVVDEPTNHLDRGAREVLLAALGRFRGVGLMVSHDRAFLDALCERVLFVGEGAPLLRAGTYSDARAQLDAEYDAASRRRVSAKRELERLRRAWNARKNEAAAADARRSKRGISARDHDAKSKVDAARVSGKDGMAGGVQKQMEGRLRQATEALDAMGAKKTQRLGVTIGGAHARRDTLVQIEPCTLPLGGDRSLAVPELRIVPGDRIAVLGENGAGKTTLLRHVTASLELPRDRVTTLPQEVEASAARALLEQARALPHDRLGEVMTIVSCLGSDPGQLLDSKLPSPGETRKLLLALGMSSEPVLLILDEPTNHLDVTSIECLESALDACPAALLLVSHDERLVEMLTTSVWRVADGCVTAER